MTKHKGIRLLSLAIAFVFLSSTALTTLVSTNASANVQNLDSFYYTEDIYKDVSKRQHYYWLYGCMRNADIGSLSSGQVSGWDFFEGSDQESALGHMYDTNGSVAPCSNQDIVKTAAAYLGKTDSKAFFCGLTGSMSMPGAGLPTACNASEAVSWFNNANGSQLATDYSADVGGVPANTRPRPMQYLRAYATLMQGCEVTFANSTVYDTATAARDGSTDSTVIGVPVIVKNDRDIFVKKYKTGKIGNLSNALIMVGNTSVSNTPWTTTGCTELRNIADDTALDYQIYLTSNKDKVISSVAGPDSTPGAGSTGGGEDTCEVSGFGWLICPLINMIGEATEQVAGLLDDYLRVQPLTFDTDSPLYKGWSSLLGIANIMLILAILAIVFSQATSLGISNYGVKKMLPKVVAAAILINISYFICAVMVDISNIVGAGIADLITGTIGGVGNAGGSSGIVGAIVAFRDAVMSGIFVLSGMVIIIFFFLVPAFISILTIFIVIAARSAILTLLIILSPLAFAAWVLPNTEKYFKKWLDLFVQMLVIYPAIMAIFAASTVASSIVINGDSITSVETPGPSNLFPLIIGLLIQALPIFALPALIKASSGVLGRIENMSRAGMKKYGGDATEARVQGYKKIGMAAAAQRYTPGYDSDPNRTGGRFSRAVRNTGGRAVGVAARAPQRKAAWEQRVGNAEEQQKTLLAERAVAGATGSRLADRSNQRIARSLDNSKDIKDRSDVAVGRHGAAYEASRRDAAGDLTQRGVRMAELENVERDTKTEKDLTKEVIDRGARAAVAGGPAPAWAASSGQSFVRSIDAADRAAGAADDLQEAYESVVRDTMRTGAPSAGQAWAGEAVQARAGKTNAAEKLKGTKTDAEAAYKERVKAVMKGATGQPAWAVEGAAVTSASKTADDTLGAANKGIEQAYDDTVNAALQPGAVPTTASRARRNLERSTLGATNAAGRVKQTLKAQSVAGATGADAVLVAAEQEAIRISKGTSTAEAKIKRDFARDAASNPAGADAQLERESIQAGEQVTEAELDIRTQYDEARATAALDPTTATPEGQEAVRLADEKFQLEQRTANANREEQRVRAKKVVTNSSYATAAGGVAGAAGADRARAAAVSSLLTAQDEGVNTQIKLLEYQSREANTTLQKVSSAVANAYMDGKSDTDVNGLKIDITPEVAEAAIEQQAKEGNMSLFKKARGIETVAATATTPASGIDQTIVDRVISRNLGTFKGKGGFHLQRNFDLRRDKYAGDAEWQAAIKAAEISTMANVDAMHLGDLKWVWFDDFATELNANPAAYIAEARTGLEPGSTTKNVINETDLQKMYDNLYEALNNDNARAGIGDRLPQVIALEASLSAQGFTHS